MATKLSTITDKSDIAADVFNCLLAGQMRPFNNLIVALEHKVWSNNELESDFSA